MIYFRRMALALLVVVILTAGAPALADQSAENGLPHNIYGTHPMITDIMTPWHIETHLTWTRTLTGPGGWVKILMYPIRPDTVGAQESWRQFVQTCYNKELIPVIRIGLWMQQGGAWVKPPKDSDGSYRSIAQAIKRVVMSLPKDDNIPLYIELLNEPNNAVEWSGEYPEPIEYARFFVETSNAIRSLADPRIKIATGALSPGGTYDNLLYIEEMCTHVPEFINAWDVWCTHPYTNIPPEINHHDGTAGMNRYTIDHYVLELEVLARYGRTNVKVFGAEGGYIGGHPDDRADKMMRAFRDYYSKWPEVLGMSPWFLSNPFQIEDGVDWVRNDSVGAYPSGSARIYDMVYKLAKPWMTTGTVSGKVTESQFNSPLSNVQVILQPGGQSYMTDTAGNYIFPSLSPGTYSVEVTKPHYTSGSKADIVVAATKNEVANFQLEATAGIVLKGTLRDSLSNEPLEGVRVTVAPGGFQAFTDAQGQYEFNDLPPSTYLLTGQKSGYYTFTTPALKLEAGEERVVNWWHGPGAPPPGNSLLERSWMEFEVATAGGQAEGWTTSDGQAHPNTFFVDPSERYNGIASQRMTPNGASANRIWTISNYSAIQTGKRYRIEAWVKTSNPNGTAIVRGNFFNNDMVHKGSFDCLPKLTTPSGWTRYVGIATAPTLGAPDQVGRLHVELIANLQSGTVWVDTIWAGEDITGENPVASPSAFRAQPNQPGGNIVLLFNHGVSPGTTGTLIVVRDDRYPMTPTDGTVVTDKEGSPGSGDGAWHLGPGWSKRYYYAAFSHKAGGADMSRPVFATAILPDTTPPTPPGNVTDEGKYSFSTNTLTCSWSASSDPQTGVSGYRIRIGTSQGSGSLLDWTDVGNVTSVTRPGLALVNGQTYYFTIQARNGAGLFSASSFSDGITIASETDSIGQAKTLPDGRLVKVGPAVASSSSGQISDRIYLQEEDRSAGIGAKPGGFTAGDGDRITLVGRLTSDKTERYLEQADLLAKASGASPEPVSLNNRSIGGGPFHYWAGPPASGQIGATDAFGANNVGLLVRTWGRVLGTGSGYFDISDGSLASLRVFHPAGLFNKPQVGSFVACTGLSGLREEAGILHPALRLRSALDILTLYEAP